MGKIYQGFNVFISDCFIQGLENKDSIYSFLSTIGLTHEEFYSRFLDEDLKSLNLFFKKFYLFSQKNIVSNVMITHADKVAKVYNADYHEKFGWVLESKIGKAYLGKISMPSGYEMTIGLMSYISGNSILRGDSKLEIGSFCSIASGANIMTTNYSHPTAYPSTYNFRSNDRIVAENMEFNISFKPVREKKHEVVIGNDVWVGKDVMVMNGVNLGDGCVVGAKSLIVKDCKPYGIYGGTPAKLIRYRFPERIVEALIKIKWWNWSYEKIKRNKEFFDTNLLDYIDDLNGLVK